MNIAKQRKNTHWDTLVLQMNVNFQHVSEVFRQKKTFLMGKNHWKFVQTS